MKDNDVKREIDRITEHRKLLMNDQRLVGLHVVNQILEDLKGYSGVGEDGNPYDTSSWNAALKAVRNIIEVRLTHDDR